MKYEYVVVIALTPADGKGRQASLLSTLRTVIKLISSNSDLAGSLQLVDGMQENEEEEEVGKVSSSLFRICAFAVLRYEKKM